MGQSGGCRCGAVRFSVEGTPRVALCHCGDCRKSSGAPMMAWAAFAEDELEVTKGVPKVFNSSGEAFRSFCGDCGTGLFYRNAVFLPGIVDIQSATLDHPEAFPAQAHIQTIEQIDWMKTAHNLPMFDRFPE